MSPTEEWRTVRRNPAYEVSSLGRVRRVRSTSHRHPVTGKVLKGAVDKTTGYLKVALHGNGRQQTSAVHVLVCEAFHGERPRGLDARHLDCNKANNTAANLAWGTRRENNLDGVRAGRNNNTAKTTCKWGHPLSGTNLYPYKLNEGHRKCCTCARARSAVQRARHRGEDIAFETALKAYEISP